MGDGDWPFLLSSLSPFSSLSVSLSVSLPWVEISIIFFLLPPSPFSSPPSSLTWQKIYVAHKLLLQPPSMQNCWIVSLVALFLFVSLSLTCVHTTHIFLPFCYIHLPSFLIFSHVRAWVHNGEKCFSPSLHLLLPSLPMLSCACKCVCKGDEKIPSSSLFPFLPLFFLSSSSSFFSLAQLNSLLSCIDISLLRVRAFFWHTFPLFPHPLPLFLTILSTSFMRAHVSSLTAQLIALSTLSPSCAEISRVHPKNLCVTSPLLSLSQAWASPLCTSLSPLSLMRTKTRGLDSMLLSITRERRE